MDVLEEALGVRPEAHDELGDLVFLHFVQQRCVPGVDLPEEDLAALPMARAVREQRRVQSVPRSTRHDTRHIRSRNEHGQRAGLEGGGGWIVQVPDHRYARPIRVERTPSVEQRADRRARAEDDERAPEHRQVHHVACARPAPHTYQHQPTHSSTPGGEAVRTVCLSPLREREPAVRERDLVRVPEEGQASRAGRERAAASSSLVLDLGQAVQREEEREAGEELEQHRGVSALAKG